MIAAPAVAKAAVQVGGASSSSGGEPEQGAEREPVPCGLETVPGAGREPVPPAPAVQSSRPKVQDLDASHYFKHFPSNDGGAQNAAVGVGCESMPPAAGAGARREPEPPAPPALTPSQGVETLDKSHYFSRRPEDVWPEMWSTMSCKQKERALEAWETRRVAIERARAVRCESSDVHEAPQAYSASSPREAPCAENSTRPTVREVTPRSPVRRKDSPPASTRYRCDYAGG